MTSPAIFDVAGQSVRTVHVIPRAGRYDLSDELLVHLDGASVTLPDPVGVWEKVTAALLAAGIEGIDRAWMHEHVGTDPKEKP